MTTTFIATACHTVGTADNYETVYDSDHIEHPTREGAWSHGCKIYGSDDFRIATLTDGQLTAIGWGAGDDAKDFDPIDEDLGGIARQLGLRLDVSWGRNVFHDHPGSVDVVRLVDKYISSSIGNSELAVCCYLCDPIEGKAIVSLTGTAIVADIIKAGLNHLVSVHTAQVNQS